MDIISHGLWGAVLAAAARTTKRATDAPRNRLQPLLGFFWGTFPDLAAFTPIVVFFVLGSLSGELDPGRVPRPEVLAAFTPRMPIIYWLTFALYSLSHSAVVFLVIFLGVWLVRYYHHRHAGRRIPLGAAPVWEMSAWLLHILIDIPTHSSAFFPTPFLWPISTFHVDGTPWATPWIWGSNVLLLVGAFVALRRRARS